MVSKDELEDEQIEGQILDKKLDAMVAINRAYAEALGKNRLVPDIVFGQQSGEGATGATDLINMLMVKTAKDLTLDNSVQAATPVTRP